MESPHVIPTPPYEHIPHTPAVATIEAKRQPRAKRRTRARRLQRYLKRWAAWQEQLGCEQDRAADIKLQKSLDVAGLAASKVGLGC